MRYAHVDVDGLVVNVSVWDGTTPYDAGEGITLVKVERLACGPGWTYDGTVFMPPADDGDDA